MRLTAPLDDALASRSHVRVLRALDALPEGFAASTRDVARRAGVSHPTASHVLSSLARQGLARARRYGPADTYELNRSHVLFDVLHAAFEREAKVGSELTTLLASSIGTIIGSVRRAYVFGSAARGTMRPESDIDVAVELPVGLRADLDSAGAKLSSLVRERFGNEVSLHWGRTRRRESPRADGTELWSEIERAGIPLVLSRRKS